MEKGLERVVINSYKAGISVEDISKITGFHPDTIIRILKNQGLINS